MVNIADGDWLAAVGFGLFAVVMVIQALDDLRWHGRHEPLTGTLRKWIGAVIILVAVLLVGELLFATYDAKCVRPGPGQAPDRVEPPGQPAGDCGVP